MNIYQGKPFEIISDIGSGIDYRKRIKRTYETNISK